MEAAVLFDTLTYITLVTAYFILSVASELQQCILKFTCFIGNRIKNNNTIQLDNTVGQVNNRLAPSIQYINTYVVLTYLQSVLRN